MEQCRTCSFLPGRGVRRPFLLRLGGGNGVDVSPLGGRGGLIFWFSIDWNLSILLKFDFYLILIYVPFSNESAFWDDDETYHHKKHKINVVHIAHI